MSVIQGSLPAGKGFGVVCLMAIPAVLTVGQALATYSVIPFSKASISTKTIYSIITLAVDIFSLIGSAYLVKKHKDIGDSKSMGRGMYLTGSVISTGFSIFLLFKLALTPHK